MRLICTNPVCCSGHLIKRKIRIRRESLLLSAFAFLLYSFLLKLNNKNHVCISDSIKLDEPVVWMRFVDFILLFYSAHFSKCCNKPLKSSAAWFANVIPHPPPRPPLALHTSGFVFLRLSPFHQINVSPDLRQGRQIQSSSAAPLWIVEDDDGPSHQPIPCGPERCG